MGAALGGVNVVGEGVDVLLIAVVVLERHFHGGIVHHALHVDGLVEEYFLVLVEILDELDDAALVVVHPLILGLHPLVGQGDADALVQEGHLAQAHFQDVELELAGFEYAVGVFFAAGIGPELHGGTGAVGFADHLQIVADLAPVVFLLVHLAVLIDGDLQVAAQSVDNAGAYAVQTAGDLVAVAAELTASVEHRQADFHCRTAEFGMNAHGEAAAIVLHFAGAVLVQGHVDVGAVAGKGFVHGVIHDLVHAVMQAPEVGGANIHARAFPDGFQTFQHLNLGFVICVLFHMSGRNRAFYGGFQLVHRVHIGGHFAHAGSTPLAPCFHGRF